MSEGLPIWIVEPESAKKRDFLATKLFKRGQKAALSQEITSIDDIKQQLKEIRKYARDNIDSLIQELKTTLNQKYPQVAVKWASDSIEAVRYITEISDGIRTVSINNSSIVNLELKPGLITSGFTVINSYLNEFDSKEKKLLDYWALPQLLDKNLVGTFDVSIEMAGQYQPGVADAEIKHYLAVLGVNTIPAEDGTVFFLQHFSNIYNDLKQAEKVILIVGLDKIVKRKEDAAFQTKCMGIFGLESVLLGIQPKPDKTTAIAEIPLSSGDKDRELHIIILDNSRTNLLQDNRFKDLFLCISCRACIQHCPISHAFIDKDYSWSSKTYLTEFLRGNIDSIAVCLHCGACRIACPLDIDLPHLMWQAEANRICNPGRPLKRKILGSPELLAKLGSLFAPIANWMMDIKLVRIPMEIITGIDRKANLPTFHFQTFRKWFNKNV